MAAAPKDISSHFDHFSIDPEVLTVGLDLVVNGIKFDSVDKYAFPHPEYPAGTIYLQITTPDRARGIKGGVSLVKKIDVKDHVEPLITADLINHRLMTYLGHDIRLHPQYVQHSEDNKTGRDSGSKFIVKTMIIKGRGAITYLA